MSTTFIKVIHGHVLILFFLARAQCLGNLGLYVFCLIQLLLLLDRDPREGRAERSWPRTSHGPFHDFPQALNLLAFEAHYEQGRPRGGDETVP